MAHDSSRTDEDLVAVRIVVAVLTYRRNEDLARLLPLLVEQCDGLSARVVVVDNDPLAGAEPVVRQHAGLSVTYLHEPVPGIAAARNRALQAASADDVLVFIDDDELPTAGWLREIVGRWVEWRCTAVAGAVRHELAVDAPWVRASGELDRVHRPTGTTLRGAATSNLLLDVAATAALGVRFDERFGLTGGEDTMFTHSIVRRGGTIRWSDEAEVVAPVPAHRSSSRWVLRRAFRAGTTWSRIEILLAGSTVRRGTARVELVGRGLVRFTRGALRLTAGCAGTGIRDRARGLFAIVSAAGMVLGALGYAHEEYARPPQAAGSVAS